MKNVLVCIAVLWACGGDGRIKFVLKIIKAAVTTAKSVKGSTKRPGRTCVIWSSFRNKVEERVSNNREVKSIDTHACVVLRAFFCYYHVALAMKDSCDNHGTSSLRHAANLRRCWPSGRFRTQTKRRHFLKSKSYSMPFTFRYRNMQHIIKYA